MMTAIIKAQPRNGTLTLQNGNSPTLPSHKTTHAIHTSDVVIDTTTGELVKGREVDVAEFNFDFLTIETTARILGKSIVTLAQGPGAGKGPRFLKIGGSVRYRKADVLAWLDGCTTGGGK